MHEDESDSKFAELDDVAFLDEHRRLREALEHVPESERDPEMVALFGRMTEEFTRRARVAWSGGANQ